jgi:galactonate dehydratase
MKITGFETLFVDGGWDTYAYLKVTTDAGLVGWSEFSDRRGRHGLAGLVLSVGDMLIGDDPRALTALEAKIHTMTRSTAGGLQAHATGAIVNACLDIKAQSLGVPVYELLGGAVRKRVPVYWSRCGVTRALHARMFDGNVLPQAGVHAVGDFKAAGREAEERGFKALKTNVILFGEKGARRAYTRNATSAIGHPDLNFGADVEDALVAQLTALREGAGNGVRLIVDLNFDYKTEGFRRLAKRLEPFDLLWLEMDSHNPQALAFIRQSTTTPIGSLEAVLGRRSLKTYLDAQAVDVAIVDVQYNGMLESMRMAALADIYDVNVASHAFAGPLSSVISAHFCAAIPNFKMMECDIDEMPWRPQLLTTPYVIEAGEFVLPTGPGWGTAVNEDVLRAHAAKD